MTRATKTRWVIFILGAEALLIYLYHDRSSAVHIASFWGWILLGVIIFLMLFGARKRLPTPPLGSASLWLNLHLSIGMLSIAFYVLHTGVRVPNGKLEILLAGVFLSIVGSGIFGMILSTSFARRLHARGGEVIYEQIPAMRHDIAFQADNAALRSVEALDSSVVLDFHTSHLKPFFQKPMHFWAHLRDSRLPLATIERAIYSFQDCLDPDEVYVLDPLKELVERKDALDYHHALQKTLKAWLFIHVPLSLVLLILVGVHIVLVLAFCWRAS